jgi:signal transduction histidine kinase
VHDLKDPLSTIDLRAALLLLDATLPAQARSSIERIRTQVRSALLQVLNLLDIRMLDEGRLEARYEPVDLFRMVRELLADFDTKAQARALTLRSDIEVPQITADPDLLRRVLANLLDNAVRHAPNGSVVAVTAHRIAGARVELRVVDAGASIPGNMTERIFDPFVQVEEAGAAYRHRTGRGLGLAFCKLAVEAHRGEIAVTNIDKRTVFSIKLPETYKSSGT